MRFYRVVIKRDFRSIKQLAVRFHGHQCFTFRQCDGACDFNVNAFCCLYQSSLDLGGDYFTETIRCESCIAEFGEG